ncbi:MAG: hypothetical protein EBQ65_07565 [Chitinophagaceae bacterium]|nr:hypothetical protein [Chitinophagaceae bacterium]
MYASNKAGSPFANAGEFISLPSAGFFFHVYNTGRIYKLDNSSLKDSILLFKRIDHTVNIYYNIGSFLFAHNNQIFDFGGYGFWKNNGLLRKFNFRDKEWDIVELDKEIFPPNVISDGYVTWVDSAQNYLYVPYQEVRNDGLTMLKEDDDIDFNSHRLDFKTLKWEHLGQLDEQVYQTMKYAIHIFQSEKGLLLVYINRVYWVDFLNNQVKVTFDPTLGQTLLRIQRYMLRYWNGEYVYWTNPVNGLYDSTRIDLSKFNYEGQAIWKKTFHAKELILLAALVIVLVIFFFIQIRQPKRQIIADQELVEQEAPFTGTELALLSLLLSKHKIGKTATIPEINYVLGLKDKNHGMQKKVRSEIINKINEKYLLISKGKEMLIQNIRSESDKRFFEYLVNPELVEHLRKLTAQST